MAIDVDIRLLRAFLTIAECRSVTLAAARMGYSQSAMSQQLARIERWAGGSLFERGRGGMSLNAYGRALLPLAREIVDSFDQFLLSVRSAERTPPKTINSIR